MPWIWVFQHKVSPPNHCPLLQTPARAGLGLEIHMRYVTWSLSWHVTVVVCKKKKHGNRCSDFIDILSLLLSRCRINCFIFKLVFHTNTDWTDVSYWIHIECGKPSVAAVHCVRATMAKEQIVTQRSWATREMGVCLQQTLRPDCWSTVTSVKKKRHRNGGESASCWGLLKVVG